MEIRNIVVPVDFSDRSAAAAEHAAVLAKHFDAGLTLVHVTPEWPTGYEKEALEQDTKTAEELEALWAKVGHGLRAEKLLLRGDPAQKIEEVAAGKDGALVVIPTHGYGPFRRFLLGSVATKVLHDIDCPVLTGTHVAEVASFSIEPYKRVACAIDLREHSEAVLRWAAAFAESFEADLVVVHAAPVLEMGGTYGDWFPPESRATLIRNTEADVQELLAETHISAEVYVDSAEAGRYVPRAVEEARADLLVIGRSLENGLLGRLRTHAHALIREAPCPVISI